MMMHIFTIREGSRSERRFLGALHAVLVLVLAVLGGLGASLYYDTPSGPSVVAAAFIIFLISRLPWPGRAPA